MADRPTAAELVVAVREFLERDVLGAVDGRVGFHVRVAVNALGIVERELEHGAANDAAERAHLEALLGDADADADSSLDDLRRTLAARIRDGVLDDRRAELHAALREVTAATLAVDNPRYAGDPTP